MTKALTLPILVIAAIVIAVILLVSKPIDCTVSESNPYSKLPMVCKSVLKIP